jgi:hypothetical protein
MIDTSTAFGVDGESNRAESTGTMNAKTELADAILASHRFGYAGSCEISETACTGLPLYSATFPRTPLRLLC